LGKIVMLKCFDEFYRHIAVTASNRAGVPILGDFYLISRRNLFGYPSNPVMRSKTSTKMQVG